MISGNLGANLHRNNFFYQRLNIAEFRESILSQKDKMSGDAKPVKASSEPSEGDLAELTASVKRIEVLLEKLVASK